MAYRAPDRPCRTWGACFNDRTPDRVRDRSSPPPSRRRTSRVRRTYLAPAGAARTSSEHNPFLAIVRRSCKQGWEIDRPRWGVFAIQAPDGLAGMEFATGDLDPEAELSTRDARWQLWAGKSIDRPVWYATASTDTPVALLTAVTECVADPAPLLRWRQDTYSYIKGMAQLTPILPPPPTPRDVRRALAARRPAALPATSVPRWSTTSRPALPGPRR
ncbi:hypothetical protein SMICM304S_00342 [Streptomyces microflavus]